MLVASLEATAGSVIANAYRISPASSGVSQRCVGEFTAADGRFADYKQLAEGLNEQVRRFDGLISIERFQSIGDPARPGIR